MQSGNPRHLSEQLPNIIGHSEIVDYKHARMSFTAAKLNFTVSIDCALYMTWRRPPLVGSSQRWNSLLLTNVLYSHTNTSFCFKTSIMTTVKRFCKIDWALQEMNNKFLSILYRNLRQRRRFVSSVKRSEGGMPKAQGKVSSIALFFYIRANSYCCSVLIQ